MQTKRFMAENPWIFIVSLIINITVCYALICCESNSRTVPRNYVLLGIFTFTEGLFVSAITSLYEPELIIIAFAITSAMVIGLTIYAVTTSEDFTVCGGFLFAFSIIVFMAMIL